jgi:DNA mismatch repair protein MutS
VRRPRPAVEGYIAQLVRAGRRVAICDQTEDPRNVKGIVPREVVRVISPGTVTEPGLLEARAANYVAATAVSGTAAGLALADLSTGEFLAWDGDLARAREILAGYGPARSSTRGASLPDALLGDLAGTRAALPAPGMDLRGAVRARRRFWPTSASRRSTASGWAGARSRSRAAPAPSSPSLRTRRRPRSGTSRASGCSTAASCLVLDQTTRKNLEIVRSLSEEGGRATLVGVLD